LRTALDDHDLATGIATLGIAAVTARLQAVIDRETVNMANTKSAPAKTPVQDEQDDTQAKPLTKEQWEMFFKEKDVNPASFLAWLKQRKPDGATINRLGDYRGTIFTLTELLPQYHYDMEGRQDEYESDDPPASTTEDSQYGAQISDDGPVDKSTIRKRYTQKVSGKDYLKAGGRVILFRMDHPDWTIATEALNVNEAFAVFKASILNAEGRVISTGHGAAALSASKNISGRYIEKAETAAIARALSLCGGYGTDDSFDDIDHLADSPQ